MLATTEPLTAEDFLARPDDGPVDLVRGEPRTMTRGSWAHAKVAGRVFLLLSAHVEPRALGECFGDNAGFRLTIPGDDSETVRSPDAAFIRAERVPRDGIPFGWVPFAPDLAVEVLSPSDRATELQEKLDDYLAAGTAAVWVIDPARRAVEVHTADDRIRRLRDGDTLDGAPVLPDLRIPVADLFAGLAHVDVR